MYHSQCSRIVCGRAADMPLGWHVYRHREEGTVRLVKEAQ